MRYCVDCKWFKCNMLCNNPKNGMSFTNGDSNVRFAIINRRGECGQEASWFEQIVKPLSFLGKVKKLFMSK